MKKKNYESVNIKYKPEIDGLRAIAVCGVIFFHSFPDNFKGGFLGVDNFFVISGYLIGAIIYREYAQGQFRLIDFWERRIRRIYPALILIVFLTLILTYHAYFPVDFQSVGRSTVALSLFASNIYFWLKTGYFNPTADTIPLLHTWSLAVEEQFYFIFPILFLGISKVREKFIIIPES